MVAAVSKSSLLTSLEVLFDKIWFCIEPFLKVPSLDLLDGFFTTSFSFLLQNYSPNEPTASSPNSTTSYVVEMVPSVIVTIGAGWEVLGVGIDILTEGITVEGVEA